MAGYLIAEEGPLAGLIIRFEEGKDWVLGRDPDVSFQVLEDPMVSRKHVVCHLTEEGYLLENLSAVNPASVNGKPLGEPLLLQEGDIVQIGNLFLRFTENDPAKSDMEEERGKMEGETPTIFEEVEGGDPLFFSGSGDARWIIKVISGPNAGAEFGVYPGSILIIGKNPNTCDILFQDLSVSKEHAKLIAHEDGSVAIEDLQSLNKVLVNGKEIEGRARLNSQDLVALGTTSFLIIDRETTRETILSPPSRIDQIYLREEEKEKQIVLKENEIKKDWKKMVIPTRHLALAALFIFLLILGLGGVFSLFKSKKIEVAAVDYSGEIRKVLKNFPEVEFSYNSSNGKLFILGHVLTEVDHQEMIYLLRSLSFIQSNQDIEDNVIIDELVWTNSNALLAKNPNWRGVSLTSIIPGHFVLRGYVASLEEATKLSEYLNLNFPYLDRLDNQVVVENTLQAEIQSILLEGGFSSVTFQFASGELILVGNVASDKQKNLNEALKTFKKLRGVRTVKNLTVLTKTSRELTDLSGKYTVTGSSKRGKVNQYVVIGGRILSKGDSLDGMRITAIEANAIFLEKDGTKYRINYNQQ